jgi:hypothetical protein
MGIKERGIKSMKYIIKRLSKYLIISNCFIASRSHDEISDGCFGFVWWFWFPRLLTQYPDTQNPRVIRLIWFCFAIGLEIWGVESYNVWPTNYTAICKEAINAKEKK